jgi:hypothetical protein
VSGDVTRRRRALAAIAMATIILLARLRTVVSRLRGRLQRETRRVTLGELIVMHPTENGRDMDAIVAMFGTLEHAMRRWGVTVGERRSVKHQGLELSRTYVRLHVAMGAEDDALRAINVASWKYGLPRGRRGVLAVRSPAIIPAAAEGPPGPITFTDAYVEAKRRIGVDGGDADGVKVLIIDVDRPDRRYLPASAELEILDPSDRAISDGHATLMTAIVADIAGGAKITTRSICDDDSSQGFWALLDVLTSEQDADLIVASVTAPEGGSSKDGRGRDNVFDSLLRSRVLFPNRPPIVFPTGNHEFEPGGERIDEIAIPARFESVVAIGACDESGGRSTGSRFGVKTGGDPHAWWLAPGGSFPGQSVWNALVEMDGRPQAGTSIANAMAAGLIACLIRSRRERQPGADLGFDSAVEGLMSGLRAHPGAERPLALASGLLDVHSGGSVTLAKLIAELETLSDPDGIRGYDVHEHGCGMLCLDRLGPVT